MIDSKSETKESGRSVLEIGLSFGLQRKYDVLACFAVNLRPPTPSHSGSSLLKLPTREIGQWANGDDTNAV
jgi:hypothetical protein